MQSKCQTANSEQSTGSAVVRHFNLCYVFSLAVWTSQSEESTYTSSYRICDLLPGRLKLLQHYANWHTPLPHRHVPSKGVFLFSFFFLTLSVCRINAQRPGVLRKTGYCVPRWRHTHKKFLMGTDAEKVLLQPTWLRLAVGSTRTWTPLNK